MVWAPSWPSLAQRRAGGVGWGGGFLIWPLEGEGVEPVPRAAGRFSRSVQTAISPIGSRPGKALVPKLPSPACRPHSAFPLPSFTCKTQVARSSYFVSISTLFLGQRLGCGLPQAGVLGAPP